MSSGKWQPFCVGLNVLTYVIDQKYNMDIISAEQTGQIMEGIHLNKTPHSSP